MGSLSDNLYTISLKSNIDEWTNKIYFLYINGYDRIPFNKRKNLLKKDLILDMKVKN